MNRTYQTRIVAESKQDACFTAYAQLYNKVERKLFARMQTEQNIAVLKREFLRKFGLTARQFNAMSAELTGKIDSIKRLRDTHIQELTNRIKRAGKVLKKVTEPDKMHQKTRRLVILKQQLAKLKADKESGTVRLCFGSRKLFKAQFNPGANGFTSHADWLKDWQSKRDSQFFVIGSKDETAGCQSCVATVAPDGSINLKLRLPNGFASKYLTLTDMRFAYGHDTVVAAIGRNLSPDKNNWTALSYRFAQDVKGWKVFVTTDIQEPARISRKDLGVIGVDINEHHLAVTETDRFGNPVNSWKIPCVTYGKTKNQRLAVIGDAVKQVTAIACQTVKPLAIEKLDFKKKKSNLEGQGKKYARMLSSLAYTQIQTVLRARVFDAGIEVVEDNPAYTSIIGQNKFASRYGLSVHNAAALVIGRRIMGFSETLPSQLHVTLPLPVRNRSRHVWSKWAVVSRLAKQRVQRSNGRARPDPRGLRPTTLYAPVGTALLETIPFAGEIPDCESSIILFD